MRDNNFDTIRLLAALQVVVSHAASHLHVELPIWLNFLGYFPGVPVFFIVSGFLISASFERAPTIKQYAVNRFLRIYPALWVCLAFSVVVILVSDVVIHPKSFLIWLIAQGSFLQFYNPDFLRGFGVGVLNGSLWTIPVEMQFYFILPFLMFFVRDWSNRLKILLVIFSLLLMILSRAFMAPDTRIVEKIVHVSLLPYLFNFLVGVVLRVIHERTRVFWDSFTKFLGLYFLLIVLHELAGVGGATGNNLNPVQIIALGSLIVSAAFSNVSFSKKILRGNDISYGLYIYHMPIVNFLIFKEIFGGQGMIVCLVATVIMGGLSWRFVEKPVLGLKSYSIAK